MLAALRPLAEHAHESAVLVDFDGSLAPIVDNPEESVALPAARDALGALVGQVALVAVVSGRPVAFLVDRVGLEGVTYVGQYGLQRWVGGRVLTDPRVEPYLAAVEAAAVAAARDLPGVLVERKEGVAVVVHWRRNPELEGRASEWAARMAASTGLELHPARMAAELRPPVAVDKGDVVEEVCRGLVAAAFAGDDAGDLTAFGALDTLQRDGGLAHAVRIAVRSPEEPAELVARADVEVVGPAGLAVLLDDLAAAIRNAPA